MSRSFIGESMHQRNRSRPVMTMVSLAALWVVSLSGCTQDEHAQDASRYPSAIERLAVRRERPDPLVESQARGRQVYEHYCQICHGEEAQGNGFNAAMLTPLPRNFADEAFWEQTDDAHLRKVISQGGKSVGKSVLMPAWERTIDESQIHDVISFLRTVPELVRQAAEAEAKNDSDDRD